jgi:4'-phosphopantetheinyl transferase
MRGIKAVRREQEVEDWVELHPVVTLCPADLAESKSVQDVSDAARKALEYSAELSAVSLGRLDKDVNGAPFPSNGICWSVSHTRGCVAAVVAPCRIGIDIEEILEVSDLLKEEIASETEWRIAQEYDPIMFFRYWTAKEAVLKATGRGLSGLPACRVVDLVDATRIRLDLMGEEWLVEQNLVRGEPMGTGADFMAAITARGQNTVWHLVG